MRRTIVIAGILLAFATPTWAQDAEGGACRRARLLLGALDLALASENDPWVSEQRDALVDKRRAARRRVAASCTASPAPRTLQLPASTRVGRALRPWWRLVHHAARRHGLAPELVAAVVWVESAGNYRAVSPKGARGLMQLMPATARDLGVRDAFDPAANVDGGTRYLRWLLESFDNNEVLALAAYNAGPTRIRDGRRWPAETRAYVRKVLAMRDELRRAGPR
jgi:soluble lytic murein transglycosylase-like protein